MPVTIDITEDIQRFIGPLLEEIRELKQKISGNIELLTREDLSKIFKVRVESIDKWVREGHLPSHDFRVGRVRYWNRQKLFDFLEKENRTKKLRHRPSQSG